MPVIPDENALGRRPVPVSRRAITVDQSGVIVARAAVEAGAQVSQAIAAKQVRDDRFAYSKAKSSLLRADIAMRRKLEEEQPDYEKWEEQYREGMSEALDNAAGMITSASDRDLFQSDSMVDIDRGSKVMFGKAFERETQDGVASLESDLTENRTAGLLASDVDTRRSIMANTLDRINSALAKKYITAPQAQALRESWTQDFATAYVKVQDVEERLEMLENPKGTMAEFLDPDEQDVLLKAARREDKDNWIRTNGQDAANEILNSRGSFDEQMAAAERIKLPKREEAAIRDDVKNRIRQDFNDTKAIEKEANDNLFQELSDKIELGELTYDEVQQNPAWMEILDQGQQKTLAQTQRDRNEPKKTDWAEWTRLTLMEVDDPEGFKNLQPESYRHLMTPTQYEAFAKRVRGSRVPETFNAPNSVTNTTMKMRAALGGKTNVLTKTERGRKLTAEVVRRVHSETMRRRSETGQAGYELSEPETQEIVNNLMVEVSTPQSAFFGLIQYSSDREVFRVIGDLPDAEIREIESAFKQEFGYTPTPAEIYNTYIQYQQRQKK